MLDSDPTIFDHLGEAYYRRRDLERARRNWERALELDKSQIAIQLKLERLMSNEEPAHTSP